MNINVDTWYVYTRLLKRGRCCHRHLFSTCTSIISTLTLPQPRKEFTAVNHYQVLTTNYSSSNDTKISTESTHPEHVKNARSKACQVSRPGHGMHNPSACPSDTLIRKLDTSEFFFFRRRKHNATCRRFNNVNN